ncbi:hypothetical protein SK128_004884 [Halocaridina rubra]|uniref:Uncharacterized protein n=1 Tax=Halocaridina rubra TaxID=373956 RepID=A0AAN8WV28_HALRR
MYTSDYRRLAPDIVVDDVGDPAPIHGHGGNGESSKIPLVLLQGFFRGPGSKSPHHRRPSVLIFKAFASFCLTSSCSVTITSHKTLTSASRNLLDCFSQWECRLHIHIFNGIQSVPANVICIFPE